MPRRNTLLRTALLVTSICLASAVHAETLFVNNISGSDLNNGSTDDNQGDNAGPLRTITAALKRVKRGDRIVLANTGAFYEECVTLQGARHSGTSFSPFVIEGNGATLDGTAEVPAHKWEFIRGNVFRFVPEKGGFQQLFIEGELASQMPRVDGSYVSTFLKAKEWCRCNGGIQFATEKRKSVYAYDLRYAKHRVGITLYDVENVVIHNLKVRGFQLDGINAHDNAMDCILSQVTSTENGRSGVAVCGASRVRLVESDLRLNGDVQLHMEGWSTTHLNETKMVAKSAPVWKRSLNVYGRGAKLVIDGQLQVDIQGWNSEEDEEDAQLQRGLDDLEGQLESDRADAINLGPQNPTIAAPENMPADEPEPVETVEEIEAFDAPAPPADEEPAEEAADENLDDPFGEGDPGDDVPGDADPFGEEGDLFEDAGGDEAMDDPFG